LEILKGYVPGYDHVLGHEFVGIVEASSGRPELVGTRVVGEINCPLDNDFRWIYSSPPF
jgi:threonine dehydrogenase-like Zn-dependent dehydrogenase